MATNPYVNKVIFGETTVIDISPTTAVESDVAQGKIFFKASGEQATGTNSGGSSDGAVTQDQDGYLVLSDEPGTNIDVEPLSVTTNGTYTAPTGTAYSPVTVNVSGGGGTTPASPKDVNFIDYDGTILYGYTKAEFAQLTALPANPDHSGDDIPLTSQGWNWTLQQINAQLTAQPNDPVTVGQMYVTTDGKTYIEIELHEGRLSPYLGIAVNGTVVVDWGDNTATSTVTGTSLITQIRTLHEYAAAGRYRISISVSSGRFAFYGTSTYTLLSKNSSTMHQNRVYSNAVQSVRIGNNASVGNYAFYYCYSLASITIPSGVTSIGTYAFYYCYGVAKLRFLPTTPPTVSNSNTFTNIPTDCVISVPTGKKSAYTGATNYPDSGTYTYIEE